MQKSTLPNGTVFICVGAIIGGFFVAVFIWRAWAVWALHRRMNAANAEYVGVPSAPPTVTGSGLGDRKSAILRKSGTAFYNQAGSGGGYNMGELKKSGMDRKPDYAAAVGSGGTKGAAAARQSNLFFLLRQVLVLMALLRNAHHHTSLLVIMQQAPPLVAQS